MSEESTYPARGTEADGREKQVWNVLYEIDDPELPISIVDLGLIYGLDIDARGEGVEVFVDMTLTSTSCPAQNVLISKIENRLGNLDMVDEVTVNMIFYPSWETEMISDEGQQQLREFGLGVPQ